MNRKTMVAVFAALGAVLGATVAQAVRQTEGIEGTVLTKPGRVVKMRSRAALAATRNRSARRRRVNAAEDGARYRGSPAAGGLEVDERGVVPAPREEEREELLARENPASARARDG